MRPRALARSLTRSKEEQATGNGEEGEGITYRVRLLYENALIRDIDTATLAPRIQSRSDGRN